MIPWPKDLVHRKLISVSAGIAQRLGISRVTVRVVVLLALILVPPLALAAYLLAVLVVCWLISHRSRRTNTYL